MVGAQLQFAAASLADIKKPEVCASHPIFCFLVSVVFAVLAKETPGERFVYGAKVFGAFVDIAVALGWLMYFFPR